MKPEHLIFLSAESIPFGSAIEIPRPLTLAPRRFIARVGAAVLRDDLGMRIAAVALMFGGLACLVWVAVAYAAAL